MTTEREAFSLFAISSDGGPVDDELELRDTSPTAAGR